MPADPIEHLRQDLLAVAMRDLHYSLEAIDVAIERTAILQEQGLSEYDASVLATREVHRWPIERRIHQAPVPAGVAA